jgi:short subunit dehydrogenase-like uncharacterized protein
VAPDRPYDVVLYGASGFVGRLTAAYLAAAAPEGTRIALAGRSAGRLSRVRDELGVAWPVIVADCADRAALAELARSATAVASTVGPYGRYGRQLAAACASAGTHLADLTGEISYARWCAEHLHEVAAASGARLVNSCGYDSVPSDLAVLLAAGAARAAGAGGLTDTVLVARGRGGVSGGTLASLHSELDAAAAEPGGRQVLADPYSLSPDRAGEADLGPQPDVFVPHIDPLVGEWVAPFVMAPYNTRIVRRSNALSGWEYGRWLRYREVMAFGRSPAGALAAGGLTAALVAGTAALAWRPTRSVAQRILPAPGQGPSDATMQRGWFSSALTARSEQGATVTARIAGRGDPGYRATARMLGEAVLGLALDAPALPDAAGVLTPATAIGHRLVERLRAAGMTLEAACDEGTGAPSAKR